MNKVSFVARWGIVFAVLGFFTLYSAAALGVGHNKAYADAISHNAAFRGSKDFVVFEDDGDGGGYHGGHGSRSARMICAIDQNQLNALRAAYATTTYTTTDVGGQPKGIAEVYKTPSVNKHALYQTIGLDTHGPQCQVLKTSESFLLFLLPGVS